MIPVTKPFLPPREEYNKYLNDIWDRQWLTNNGPLVNELETRLKQYLHVSNLLFVANGTIALQMAIKALDLKGEIITTPFSYVATTSTIVWENCTPVFADIDPLTFNIDASQIEAAITENTSAIMATHVFGNACNIDMIQAIASKHNLKVIYDAAHCFGSLYNGKSVFEYGDISTCSFHATKIFHTIEGGAVFTPQSDISDRMGLLRNFGHTSPVTFDGIGVNAKNSEFHAAMGLCCIEHMDEIFKVRKKQWQHYKSALQESNKVQLLTITKGCDFNCAYFPVVFESEEVLQKVTAALNLQYVQPRRYFYPSLNTLDYVNNNSCPQSESIAKRVLCLPIYHTLRKEDQDMITKVILKNI
ncbi:DegT/DnrJ/EryC1/StrS family aminotransferase [Chitinophaga sp. 22321]|uniref:DegT/DnrJ/EryC1/StrS family aminotransferase n=1 Tax=Chitinophaga hostae TaxID=2831022 RepID=A0ABS5J092_9BACT|nr:DegT/DnrJ/EryC1/StrS family aminotransferase [Chitinophaga hostae]MBS0028614.1 DegT/DnrJ/EryC1/StrS family aminotransferase [Chitinophaga hostae]